MGLQPSAVKMEAADSCETLVTTYLTRQFHNPRHHLSPSSKTTVLWLNHVNKRIRVNFPPPPSSHNTKRTCREAAAKDIKLHLVSCYLHGLGRPSAHPDAVLYERKYLPAILLLHTVVYRGVDPLNDDGVLLEAF